MDGMKREGRKGTETLMMLFRQLSLFFIVTSKRDFPKKGRKRERKRERKKDALGFRTAFVFNASVRFIYRVRSILLRFL
jgi:hypothetical protein